MRLSSDYIDLRFQPKSFGVFTLVDARDLPRRLKDRFRLCIQTAMRTAVPEILCGAKETERIAWEIHNERTNYELTLEEKLNWLELYRSEANTRTTTSLFVGDGVIRLGILNNRNDLIGTVHICQTSFLNRVGNIVNIKATPLLHRFTVPVYDMLTDRFTDQFIQDQANVTKFVLKTNLDVKDSPFVVKVALADSHPRNTRHEAWPATIAFDAAFSSIMNADPTIEAVQSLEGARAYNLYKLKKLNAS